LYFCLNLAVLVTPLIAVLITSSVKLSVLHYNEALCVPFCFVRPALALVSASAVPPAQSSSAGAGALTPPANASAAPPVPDAVAAAEAVIANSDWNAAEAKLGALIPLTGCRHAKAPTRLCGSTPENL
jgi:hypothetical protein